MDVERGLPGEVVENGARRQRQISELRHGEVIRLAFLGLSRGEIVIKTGYAPETVSLILASPMAKLRLEEMGKAADSAVVNVPLRATLKDELEAVAAEALELNRRLMRERDVNPAVRSRIARHFMDQVIFSVDPESSKEGTYRDILRRLDEIARAGLVGAVDVTPKHESGNGHGSSEGS